MGSWEDTHLQSAVESSLEDDPAMAGSHVRIEVEGGRVRLRGFVRSASQRERALSIARNFGGTAEVDGDLLLTP